MNTKTKARALVAGVTAAMALGSFAFAIRGDAIGVRSGSDHITLSCKSASVTTKQAGEVRVFGPGSVSVDVDNVTGRTVVSFKVPAPYFQAEILRNGTLALRQKVLCG